MSGHVSLRIAVLDKQLVDSRDLPFGRVDDVELALTGPGPPRVTALLTGAEPLGRRVGGALGRALAAPARRLRSRDRPPAPVALTPALVEHVEPMIKIRAPLSDLEAAELEAWLAVHLVEPLPGAGDARE